MGSRIAYLDCFSGISGDMFLGALVDAGVPQSLFQETVAALNVGARLEISRLDRGGISATKVDVWLAGEKDRPRQQPCAKPQHWHDQAGRHPHEHRHAPGGSGDIVQTPSSAAASGLATFHLHKSGAGRGLSKIREIINCAAVAPTAKQTAIAIFEALGGAEAKVHNLPVEQIHFHEIGAADAIVDVVCAAVGSQALGVREWVCSPLNLGGGTVQCAHGRFPVPAPAVVELLQGAPVFSSGIDAELVTPTGAAIVKVLADRFAPLPAMKIERSGYGAGSLNFDHQPNVLRVVIGEREMPSGIDLRQGVSSQEIIRVLEANVDDLNPQVFGYVMERALAEGALDIFATPVQMKKNRPGMLLTVLCRAEDAQRLIHVLFAETTTLGVRMRKERRQVLVRHTVAVQTSWGEVRMKVANLNRTVVNYAPEYEDCRRIASERHVPLKHVMQEAVRIYLQQQHE